MREKLLRSTASVLRSLPSFRGKYRIGTITQKMLMGKNAYQQPEVMVKMKKDFEILIDIRSESHLGAFWCGEYDSPLIQKFCDLFEENWVVLDIGANVGYYTIPMAQRLKQLNGSLFAFEPLTKNYEALVRSADQNNLSNATIEKIGLGEKYEKLGITLTEEGETGNAVITNDALINERGWKAQEYIQIERLDDFANTHQVDRCDFIKVDIEGAEVLFLRGAKEIITQYRPVIYGEFNPYFMSKFELDLREAWDFLTGLDYEVYKQEHLARRTKYFYPVSEYQAKMSDLLFLPRSMPEAEKKRWIG